MSNSLRRKLKRKAERDEIKSIHETYNKKPKEICPNCHKKSLFMTNKEGEVFCIRCNKVVAQRKD